MSIAFEKKLTSVKLLFANRISKGFAASPLGPISEPNTILSFTAML